MFIHILASTTLYYCICVSEQPALESQTLSKLLFYPDLELDTALHSDEFQVCVTITELNLSLLSAQLVPPLPMATILVMLTSLPQFPKPTPLSLTTATHQS